MTYVLKDINYIKRQKQRKAENMKLVAEMRAALPEYNINQIREHKLPYHQALLIGLDEDGYPCTAEYIRQLLQYNEDIRNAAGGHSQAWLKPQLIESKNELAILSKALRKSEQYHIEENYFKESEEFLRIAVYFAFGSKDWWWLGEQLLIQSIGVVSEYTMLGGYFEALSRYCYGRFLTDNREYELPIAHLAKARELSTNTDWSLKIIFPDNKNTLFEHINYYLYVCYIKQAKSAMITDFGQARIFANLARARARDACHREEEAEALMLRGFCEMAMNDSSSACNTFNKALGLQHKVGCVQGACNAKLELARAHLKKGETYDALRLLLLMTKDAEDLDLPYYLGKAYYHLGQFSLSIGDGNQANVLLTESQKMFSQTNNTQECEEIQILLGISVGLKKFPKFVTLLNKTGRSDVKGQFLMKLINWKDSRKDFISKEEYESHFYSKSVKDIIAEESQRCLVAKKSVNIIYPK